jgi:hypothetical protein
MRMTSLADAGAPTPVSLTTPDCVGGSIRKFRCGWLVRFGS